MARPSILLLSVLGLLWAMGIVLTTASAVFRLLNKKDLASSESVLLILLVGFAVVTPVIVAARHVRRVIWNNSVKAVDLADKLRRPVVVGLGAYGFGSLLVRLIEAVILRKAVGRRLAAVGSRPLRDRRELRAGRVFPSRSRAAAQLATPHESVLVEVYRSLTLEPSFEEHDRGDAIDATLRFAG